MWRDAMNEIRLHPGRFVATLMAIAISVGFLAAISIFVSSEQQALAKNNTLALSTSDIEVVGNTFDLPKEKMLAEVSAVDGVKSVYAFSASGMAALTNGERSAFVTTYAVPPEEFRWAKLLEGRYPENAYEVTLSQDALDRLGAKVGDELDAGIGESAVVKVVGKTNDPRSLFSSVGYAVSEDEYLGSVGVQVEDGADVAVVMDRISNQLGGDVTVSDAEQVRLDALNTLTGEFDLFKNLLQGFGAIALFVGGITIANTFTILVTQRRRQIALLRAVGASTGQVVGRLVAEAVLLGLIGSLIGLLIGAGVAAIGAAFTGSIFWGLVWRPAELLVAVLVGVLTTVAAAVLPSLRAAKVKPIEALQAVPSEAQARRASLLRVIACSVGAVLGVALIVTSFFADWALLWAMGGGALLAIAILLGTPLFVPPILRLLARLFGRRPTARVALLNAARNPRRAAATATALMLAVGLIATLQVGLATARTSGMAYINENFPIDVSVSYFEGVPAEAKQRFEELNGIERVLEVGTKSLTVNGQEFEVRDGQRPETQLGVRPSVQDGQLVAPQWLVPEGTIELAGQSIEVVNRDVSTALVSSSTFDALPGEARITLLWLKMTDRSSTATLNEVVKVTERTGGMMFEGGALMASVLESFLNVVLLVLTALLGVAVLIALVGVGNTLGLSVLERQRESALLRALGMQRSQLRVTLLIEAVALVGVGTLVGLLAGLFFGWLGASSLLRMIPDGDGPDLVFSIDPWWTFGLIGVCLVAACLASILPGRRAANATPTEALAID